MLRSLRTGVIDDRHAESAELPGNGLADRAHADHTDFAVAQRRFGQMKAFLRPFAGAQIALRLGQFAHGAEQEPERGVRHFFGEHFRRVGDGDAVRAGPYGVDMVITDAEARYDLKFWEA